MSAEPVLIEWWSGCKSYDVCLGSYLVGEQSAVCGVSCSLLPLPVTSRAFASRAGRRTSHCLPIQYKDRKINILSPSPPDWRKCAVISIGATPAVVCFSVYGYGARSCLRSRAELSGLKNYKLKDGVCRVLPCRMLSAGTMP